MLLLLKKFNTKLQPRRMTSRNIQSLLYAFLFFSTNNLNNSAVAFQHTYRQNTKKTSFPLPYSSALHKMSSTPDAVTNVSDGSLLFAQFKIKASQIFYKSPSGLTAAIVNLKPIVPGHVLIIPTRVVPRLSGLTEDEYDDLFRTTRIVQAKIEEYYGASASNVAIQDGKAAGQSVFHVHVHILPRSAGDFERNDDVYDALEAWEPKKTDKTTSEGRKLEVPDDEDRKPRTMQNMEEEATEYRNLF